MTDSGVTAHFPHENDIQSMFSNVFAEFESRLNRNHPETGFHDSSARVAAISTVDKGTDVAKRFLCSLFTRRNSLMPISGLPPEILARVFHLLVLEDPPLSERQNLGWARVTHVCRHWRQVALDDSSLWAKIWGIPTNRTWVSEMLARAKNASLDIKIGPISRSNRELLIMFPPHLSRTRQLRFRRLSESTLHSDSVREIFSCEAPALEHFELTPEVGWPNHSPATFPDLGGNMLFKGHAPRLRAFSLSQVVIPWTLVPRGQLTQLRMTDLDEVDDSPGYLNQFIDLLVDCPALEILILESCLPSQLTEFSQGRTIHLPHLSRLRLCGSTSRITNMLKMLKLPSSTTLHFDCISNIASIRDDFEGLRIISEHFQSSAPVEFKSLTVTIRSHRTLYITASTFPSTLQNHQTENFEGDVVGNVELVLSFCWPSKPKRGHSTELLKQACKMLPISNLEFISMFAIIIIDVNWVEVFSRCTNVTTMQATGPGTSSLVQALTAGSSKKRRKRKYDSRESTMVEPAGTVAHAHAAIFPNLNFLGLTTLSYREDEHDLLMLLNVIKRGLQQRMAASGAPLKLLHISHWNISTEHANDLRRLVQDFHWDGEV